AEPERPGDALELVEGGPDPSGRACSASPNVVIDRIEDRIGLAVVDALRQRDVALLDGRECPGGDLGMLLVEGLNAPDDRAVVLVTVYEDLLDRGGDFERGAGPIRLGLTAQLE